MWGEAVGHLHCGPVEITDAPVSPAVAYEEG